MDHLAVGPASAVATAEQKLLSQPQIECPVEHFFAPGVYIRQITMPAGALVIGHMHLTEHANVILKGRALVSMDGNIEEIVAGMTFVSRCGLRKVLLVLEEMVWQTTHCIDTSKIEHVSQLTLKEKEALVDKLKPSIIRPSRAWEDRQLELDISQLNTTIEA